MNFKIVLVWIFLVSILFANNPFLTPSHSKSDTATVQKNNSVKKSSQHSKIDVPNIFHPILVETASIQRDLNKSITKLFREIKRGDSIFPLFILLMLSLVYGVIHALGPGHGKVIIGSYMLTHKSYKLTSLKIGTLVGIIHGFSAIAIVMGVYLIFKKGLVLKFDEIKSIIDSASAVIIILLGVYLLVRALLSIKRRVVNIEEINSKKSIFATALSIGIVPCPGAALILLFSINKGLIFIGILSVITMSIGMSVTISMFGFLSSLVNRCSTIFLKKESALRVVEQSLSIFGAFLVIGLGLVLAL